MSKLCATIELEQRNTQVIPLLIKKQVQLTRTQ
jgi:hypothetical protein